MSTADEHMESFEEFKKSFAYGSRTDLNFKFLAGLSDDDAARFLQELLWKLGDSIDDGSIDRLLDHVYEWQIRGYAGGGSREYDDAPFAPLRRPVAELRLALLTSSGHFAEGDDPEPFGIKGMTQEEAIDRIGECLATAPQLSAIPINTPKERLRVRHGGYDIRGALADPNVAFPAEILSELADRGTIGELASEAFSFVGACSQTQLLKEAGPQWVTRFQAERIEAVLLVPV